MSRDLTPKEKLLADQSSLSIIEFMEGLYMIEGDKKTRVYDERYIETCKKYNYLGKLYENFPQLYKEISEFKNGIKILEKTEKELKYYIENNEKNNDSFVIKWYEGKLDPNFYYSNYNDELFYEELFLLVRKQNNKGV